MNVLIVLFVITVVLAVVRFLAGRRCVHTWHTIEEVSTGKINTYVQRCTKCGNMRVKRLRIK
mgnify:CR=1 FL=1